jgi:ribosomal-protein-serine acetyltransferase
MHKELIEIPEVIETERLLIKVVKPGDGKAINEAVLESWETLGKWMPWATGEKPTVEESKVLCRQGYAKFILREDYWVGIWRKSDNKYLGGSGLHRMNWKVPLFETGYWIRDTEVGKGYVAETVLGLTKMAFEELNCKRLEIRCDSKNIRSKNVMEKCGFKHAATLEKEACTVSGELRDTLIYVRFNADDL